MEPINGYGFGLAISKLKRGDRVQRVGWNGKGMWLALDNGTGLSFSGATAPVLPFIYMSTVTGEVVPWLASQTDVLADDWQDVQ